MWLNTIKIYDANENGVIEVDELRKYLEDRLRSRHYEKIESNLLNEYTSTLHRMFDLNEDEVLDVYEMERLMRISSNFDLEKLHEITSVKHAHVDLFFRLYDVNKNHKIDEDELDVFLYEYLHANEKKRHIDEIYRLKSHILKQVNLSGTGAGLSKEDFGAILIIMKHGELLVSNR
ncbi:calbindin-like protein [Dinothrombium tinctorium]|uniref:Calbindin-like protein n=1 Tax=Dinothrombium tinctorium TaxID=1965070 RepID=A0A443QZ97_9ACAR|nr:calbindin-like protein [Dinothrombium tinctorium]